MDRTRRKVAASLGALGAAIAAGMLVFFIRNAGGGPGNIALMLAVLGVAALQSVPLAGLVAVLWPRLGGARWAVLAAAALVVIAALIVLGLPVIVPVAVTAIFTALLHTGRRAWFNTWLGVSIPCLLIGIAASAFVLFVL